MNTKAIERNHAQHDTTHTRKRKRTGVWGRTPRFYGVRAVIVIAIDQPHTEDIQYQNTYVDMSQITKYRPRASEIIME